MMDSTNYGGPTQAEFDMKVSVDVTGNFSIAKIASAATVINTFVAKYVGGLRWDYRLIGRECEISRWGPSTWGFDDIQELTEGICGMICLGTASDCLVGSMVDATNKGMKAKSSVSQEWAKMPIITSICDRTNMVMSSSPLEVSPCWVGRALLSLAPITVMIFLRPFSSRLTVNLLKSRQRRCNLLSPPPNMSNVTMRSFIIES